jgi:TolB-like protein/tetratricopeptide (TPR) repeat protein
MFTDIVGYTSLSQKNEALAMQLLEEHRSLVRPFFSKHNGREVKTIGDAFLVEFASALEAVRCAFDIQQSMHEMNHGRLPEKQVQLRLGVHVGDVIHSQNDVYGDAVNVASRIEPLALPGGICISRQVYEDVKNKFEFPLTSIGSRELKNVGEPMEVFRVIMPWEQQSTTKEEVVLSRDRIAILPFTSFSPDPNDAFFADGVTDEIISAVAGISGLSVISRTSVIGYKGTTKRVGEIGKELAVGSILEGTFKKAGNRIRVTTQLIDVAQDRHLWAQNYDRDLDDIFAVQSDVAKQVADALRVRILSPEKERIEKKPTENTTAYALYLKGRFFWNKRGVENVMKASEYFELAVHEDPGFALGYVGQADCSIILVNWGVDIEANLRKARVMATKAIEIDPGLAEAFTTIAMVLADEYDLREAEEHYKRAIELKSSYPTAHQWYFLLLLGQLRWDEALEQIEKAIELDPLSPVINYNLGLYYDARREYTKAIELFKRVIELDPRYPPVHVELVIAYGIMKMFDDMKREATTTVELLKGTYPSIQAWVDCVTARYTNDKETLRRLLQQEETHVSEPGHLASSLASFYFYLGENDRGFRFMELAFSKGEDLSGIKYAPDFDGVRADPRYLNLLERLGLE